MTPFDDEDNIAKSDGDKSKTYHPEALPEKVTRTLYLHYGTGTYNPGQICVNDSPNAAAGDLFGGIPLMELEVEFTLPPNQGIDLQGEMLKKLEAEKAEVLAQNHMRLRAVQDKIDAMLQITYTVEK